MNPNNFELVSTQSCIVGESPLWSVLQQRWYWVDIPRKTIWSYDPATQSTHSWLCSEMVANIALTTAGTLIAAMESGIFHITLQDGPAVNASLLAALPEAGPGIRFNDGRCDRQGRYWSGTMFMDMAAARDIGNLYRYTTDDGLSAPVVSQLLTQNGLAWSPDGKTMYLSDSHPQRQLIWAFDYDTDSGTPHGQRVFADMTNMAGRPDGAAVDTYGCYWICANDGAAVVRFTPEGKVDRTISLPMKKPAMCSFGGSNLDELMITSINPDPQTPDAWAGQTLIIRPGAQGIAETLFPLEI